MRTLLFQTPPMTGADVLAWERFLAAKGFYQGPLDGSYGSPAEQASYAYQLAKGLFADGIVGAGTFSQALLDGFEPPAGTIAISGMDASVDCSKFAAQIAATGREFVVRYYSLSPSKNLTRAEALALSAAGLQIAAVYEDISDNVQYFTAALGHANATTALQLAAGVGQPAGTSRWISIRPLPM